MIVRNDNFFPQAFEIASHFMMFAGGDLDKVGRNEYVPAKEFQMRWLQTYLTGYKELPPHKVVSLLIFTYYLVL